MKEYKITANDAGRRLDRFVKKTVPNLPGALMCKYIRLKRIKLNGHRCQISDRLAEGDVLSMYISDEFFGKPSDTAFLSVPAKLDVIFENEDLLLVHKPSGLVVHEDNDGALDTLINRVLHYLYDKGEFDPEPEDAFIPALCNRLDRNTAGIVICAKTGEALRVMNQKIKDREIEKLYLCVTVGIPPKDHDRMTAYHVKINKDNLVKVYDEPREDTKTMITEYLVLKKNTEKGLALVEVHLITGRTHQIRAHMAHIGCPLLGDGKYGRNAVNREFGVKTQALQAYKLRFAFTTPAGCLEGLNGMEFETPAPWFAEEFFGGGSEEG